MAPCNTYSTWYSSVDLLYTKKYTYTQDQLLGKLL